MAGGRDSQPSWYDSDVKVPDAPGIPIEIRTGDLYKFSQEVSQELTCFITNYQEKIRPFFEKGATAFGANREFHEPHFVIQWHKNIASDTSMFLNDVVNGLTAISMAAQTIAVEYHNGDVEGAEGLDAVYDSFHPTNPEDSTNPPPDPSGDEQEGGSTDTGGKAGDDKATSPGEPPQMPSQPTGKDEVIDLGNGEKMSLRDPYQNVPELDMGDGK